MNDAKGRVSHWFRISACSCAEFAPTKRILEIKNEVAVLAVREPAPYAAAQRSAGVDTFNPSGLRAELSQRDNCSLIFQERGLLQSPLLEAARLNSPGSALYENPPM